MKDFITEVCSDGKKHQVRLIQEMEQNIGFLRQWLNEEKIDDVHKMITDEQIKKWLINTKK